MHPNWTRRSCSAALVLAALAPIAFAAPAVLAGETARERVGVYDSRVVAYAWFWSEAGTRKREELTAAATTAKAGGDSEQIKQANEAVAAFQVRSHLEVFSTAPADEALAELAPKLTEILRRTGIARLISKWDDAAMRAFGHAEQIDVTDALVAAFFSPDERQKKVMAEIKRRAPLPLARARERLASGDL